MPGRGVFTVVYWRTTAEGASGVWQKDGCCDRHWAHRWRVITGWVLVNVSLRRIGGSGQQGGVITGLGLVLAHEAPRRDASCVPRKLIRSGGLTDAGIVHAAGDGRQYQCFVRYPRGFGLSGLSLGRSLGDGILLRSDSISACIALCLVCFDKSAARDNTSRAWRYSASAILSFRDAAFSRAAATSSREIISASAARYHSRISSSGIILMLRVLGALETARIKA